MTKYLRILVPLGSALSVLFFLASILLALIFWFFISVPDAKDLKGCVTTQMYGLSLCPGSKGYAKLSQISPHLKNAVVASEDAAFWDHGGIDWNELKQSIETNLKKGRLARGGSTITQQLAKNVYLTSEKSLLRKIREAIIALRIERLYSKELILERYLNVVEFDKDVYGASAAAKHYFNKTASALTVAESAWLAFLLPNPKKYSASFHKSKLTLFTLRQITEIINRLYRFKKITDAQRDLALYDAKALFGGVSGESKELEEEFLRDSEDAESDNESGDEVLYLEEPASEKPASDKSADEESADTI